jgi:hypothetical protein
MRKIFGVIAFSLGVTAVLLSSPLFSVAGANDLTIAKLKEQLERNEELIRVLKKRVETLEQEMRKGKALQENTSQILTALQQEELPSIKEELDEAKDKWKSIDTQAFQFLQDIKINAFVDTAYDYNLNDPSSRINQLRVFDFDHNTFTLNTTELVIQKEVIEPGDLGFRADLNYGYNLPQATTSSGSFGRDEFDLQQAYVSYKAPIGSGLTVDLGKFITHLGAEVIQGYDGYNDNYSRSFLFGYAIPFTHTGLRLSYDITDQLNIQGIAVNGWDTVNDDNDTKSLGLHLGWDPSDYLSLVFNYIGGSEQMGNEDDWRQVFDLVAIIKPSNRLTFLLNYDYGMEKNVPGLGNSQWQGVSLVTRYDITDKLAMAFRSEYFRDDDGSRTGNIQDLWEITLTAEIKLNDYFILRPEYRHDSSSRRVFDDKSGFSGEQDTFAMNLIFKY